MRFVYDVDAAGRVQFGLPIPLPFEFPPNLFAGKPEVQGFLELYSRLEQIGQAPPLDKIVPMHENFMARCEQGSEDPFDWYFLGFIARVYGNWEFVKACMAKVSMLGGDFPTASQNYENLAAHDDDAAFPDTYMALLTDGTKALAGHYLSEAKAIHGEGRYHDADSLLQKYCALSFPELSQLPSISECLRIADEIASNGREEEVVRCVENLKKQDYSQNWPLRHEEFIELYKSYEDEPNRTFLAEIVVRLIRELGSEGVSVLDFGGYIGIVLKIIADNLGDERKNVSFYNIDPDRDGIEFCSKNFHFIHSCFGSDEDLVAGRFDLPDAIDIVFVNATFGIMSPKAVKNVLSYFGERAKIVVIGDDLLNYDGENVVIRFVADRFMHNYGTELAKHGFSVKEILFPPEPQRYLSGILVAKKDGV